MRKYILSNIETKRKTHPLLLSKHPMCPPLGQRLRTHLHSSMKQTDLWKIECPASVNKCTMENTIKKKTLYNNKKLWDESVSNNIAWTRCVRYIRFNHPSDIDICINLLQYIASEWWSVTPDHVEIGIYTSHIFNLSAQHSLKFETYVFQWTSIVQRLRLLCYIWDQFN